MTDERHTLLLVRALLDDGPEGENAWRILAKQVDVSKIKLTQR